MDIDQEKVERTVLALLYLTSFKDKFGCRLLPWRMASDQVFSAAPIQVAVG